MFWSVFLVILAVQFTFFVLAARRKTDVFTDISYGWTFVVLALWMYIAVAPWSWLSALLTFCLVLWWIRLAWYLFIRILCMKKDKRFDAMREKPKQFGKFRALQAISIWIIFLSSLLVYTHGVVELSLLSWLGFLFFLLWWLIETVADWQKFKAKRKYPEKFVSHGLRAKARHPNYFGEMLLWWWIFLLGSPAYQWWEWGLALLSPLFICFLLLKVSGIPLLEQQHDKRYGNDPTYQAWKKKTNLLLPL